MRNRDDLIEAELSRAIIGAFLDCYWKLGYGFTESICASALELLERKHRVQREVGVPVFYDGAKIGWFRLDMIVDGRIVLELKSTEVLPPYARRQLFNYPHCTRQQIGLLLHCDPKPKFDRQVCTRLCSADS
jgi:GxxExxY protein